MAIYQSMFMRLRGIWPEADIRFITLDPDEIKRICPEANPFVLHQRHTWEFLPIEEAASIRQAPDNPHSHAEVLLSMQDRVNSMPDATRLLAAIESSSLVLASGGGWFSDEFAAHAIGILDTLAVAKALGKPTAIFSCGFEEITDAHLVRKATAVLPTVDKIVCREGIVSPANLINLGVDRERFTVCGDDAVEIAYLQDSDPQRTGIGVNLRVAEYSGVGAGDANKLREILHQAASLYTAPLLAVPISIFGPSDPDSIAHLTSNQLAPQQASDLDSPAAIRDQLSRCRILVTGSYHAAVFALSQGVSVIAFAGSLHYQTKLNGLTELFGGEGCTVLPLEALNQQELVMNAIAAAWNTSDGISSKLKQAARSQINSSQIAYHNLAPLVETTGP